MLPIIQQYFVVGGQKTTIFRYVTGDTHCCQIGLSRKLIMIIGRSRVLDLRAESGHIRRGCHHFGPAKRDGAMELGTWLYTKLRGKKVGKDESGNVYYRSSRKRAGNREERWVIFAGEAEASRVPPEWHAWLHHTTDAPINIPAKSWQKPHQSNLTGTEAAYLPPGHDSRGGDRAPATGDYEAWKPDA